jgi:uncharacterized protein YjiS (DUF1127 family)
MSQYYKFATTQASMEGPIMRKMDVSWDTIDTIYAIDPDSHARKAVLKARDETVDPLPLVPPVRHARLRQLLLAIGRWWEKRNSRLVLRELTDGELRDIGLTRREACAEWRKSTYWN